jgi:2-iminobutanoate/2-iminopropanoate deaminase
MRKIISTNHAPAAIGPYSQAVVSPPFVYTSGQIPLDPSTGALVPGGIEAETDQVLKNLKAVLEAAGSSLSRVIKTTVFLRDMNEFAAMNTIYARYFSSEPPARSTVQAVLPKGASVEIEAVARMD